MAITRHAIELFVEPWDIVPADNAPDEEWDAAFQAHYRKVTVGKAEGKERKSDWLRRIEEEWKSLR
jgi:hypothetical protein